MSFRIGFGHDVHRLVKGRKLILGGVDVPHTHGLDGHSDADVVLHAVCDALLGAVGLGDIGGHFPNTDAQYKNISSMELLKRVYETIKSKGWGIGNVDISIIAEEPKLKAYKSQMRQNIAAVLKIVEDQVNVKAGTNEGLGFIGNKEGIAAYAVALLTKG